jgi:hypothetical protein
VLLALSLSLSLSLSSCHFSLAFFFALLPVISAKWSVNELRMLISDARASLPLSFHVFLADFGEEFRPPRFWFFKGLLLVLLLPFLTPAAFPSSDVILALPPPSFRFC